MLTHYTVVSLWWVDLKSLVVWASAVHDMNEFFLVETFLISVCKALIASLLVFSVIMQQS
jgi:hypothetical protein